MCSILVCPGLTTNRFTLKSARLCSSTFMKVTRNATQAFMLRPYNGEMMDPRALPVPSSRAASKVTKAYMILTTPSPSLTLCAMKSDQAQKGLCATPAGRPATVCPPLRVLSHHDALQFCLLSRVHSDSATFVCFCKVFCCGSTALNGFGRHSPLATPRFQISNLQSPIHPVLQPFAFILHPPKAGTSSPKVGISTPNPGISAPKVGIPAPNRARWSSLKANTPLLEPALVAFVCFCKAFRSWFHHAKWMRSPLASGISGLAAPKPGRSPRK